MSTRAIYTFTEDGTKNTFHVYKHHDGYPSGGLHTLRTAFLYFAWTLPRFEADEAAASFVAAGKAYHLIEFSKGKPETYGDGSPYPMEDWLKYGPGAHLPGGAYRASSGGGERLLPSGKWQVVAPGDIEYRYVIRKPVGNKPVTVDVFAVSQDWPTGVWSQGKVVSVDLASLLRMSDDDFKNYANGLDEKNVSLRKLAKVEA